MRARSKLQAGGIGVAVAFSRELSDCWTVGAVRRRAGECMEVQSCGGKAHAPAAKKQKAFLQFVSSVRWIILCFKLHMEKVVFRTG